LAYNGYVNRFLNCPGRQLKVNILKNTVLLLFCIFICQLAGIIGSYFTVNSIPTWYASLNKPYLNPPNWLFGPVWFTLYTLMGISLFIVWKNRKRLRGIKSTMTIFFLQLLLNTLWSIVFFGMHNIGFALVVIVLLWIFILAMIITFYRVSTVAGLLQIPYLLWLSFAVYLNISIFILN
jgi:translocator protein